MNSSASQEDDCKLPPASEHKELEEKLLDTQQEGKDEARDYYKLISELRSLGRTLRSDHEQPKFSQKPEWFQEDLFKNAGSVYERHFMGMNFAHLSGLLLLVRVDSIYETLNATGESSTVAKLFKRYYHTVKHVKTWYEGDIFDQEGPAYRSLVIVRGMHNKVCSRLNTSSDQQNTEVDGTKYVHISEYDIMITQFAFIGFIVTNAKNMGLIADFSERDLDSLLHFWRVIGYYLGASDRFNLCSYNRTDVMGICDAMIKFEYLESIVKNPIDQPPGIMSVNIVRSVKFIPMLTVYGLMRHLYEILDHETSEVEPRKGCYSNLSYTLIKLVMTRLLAYKPFRVFNNGLTRLSLYLVGKVEDWNYRRLESKFGQNLTV